MPCPTGLHGHSTPVPTIEPRCAANLIVHIANLITAGGTAPHCGRGPTRSRSRSPIVPRTRVPIAGEDRLLARSCKSRWREPPPERRICRCRATGLCAVLEQQAKMLFRGVCAVAWCAGPGTSPDAKSPPLWNWRGWGGPAARCSLVRAPSATQSVPLDPHVCPRCAPFCRLAHPGLFLGPLIASGRRARTPSHPGFSSFAGRWSGRSVPGLSRWPRSCGVHRWAARS